MQDMQSKEQVWMKTGPLPWLAQLMALVPMSQGDGVRRTSMHVVSLWRIIFMHLTSAKSLHLTHATSADCHCSSVSEGFGGVKVL